jgi:hypothetical protein
MTLRVIREEVCSDTSDCHRIDGKGRNADNLKSSRRGQHSIRINDQWRICFTWTTGHKTATARFSQGSAQYLCFRKSLRGEAFLPTGERITSGWWDPGTFPYMLHSIIIGATRSAAW